MQNLNIVTIISVPDHHDQHHSSACNNTSASSSSPRRSHASRLRDSDASPWLPGRVRTFQRCEQWFRSRRQSSAWIEDEDTPASEKSRIAGTNRG